MFSSDYIYKMGIQSDSPIHNITFIIPLPVKDGTPIVGNEILTADDFRQPGMSATLTQSPPGLDLTGAVSLQGYKPWFVVIRGDEMTPVNGSNTVYTVKKEDYFHHSQLTNYRVVPNPFGSESLIVPKFNYSWKDPDVEKADLYNIWYKSNQVPQYTFCFADYQASPSAQVTVSFSVSGENSWREAYDDTYENHYRDSFSEQFNGERHGWYSVPGSIQSGDFPGYAISFEAYPNATNPEWQQVLNHSLVNPYMPSYST
jgi:hypothetical protein